ncbi:Protein of unknown function [Cotesia congregata]|uniref:Uncharacterized protein n=1 Tax=Cotesia congregata TaxID=51543 RepID=A0A8J2HJH0_COTCN|nr:Protein of unknown function [Cotesia congregata]
MDENSARCVVSCSPSPPCPIFQALFYLLSLTQNLANTTQTFEVELNSRIKPIQQQFGFWRLQHNANSAEWGVISLTPEEMKSQTLLLDSTSQYWTPKTPQPLEDRLDPEALRTSLSRSWSTPKLHPTPNTKSETKRMVLTTMKAIITSCDKSMPQLKNRGLHRPAYWWTPEIAKLRKRCHKFPRRKKIRKTHRCVNTYTNEYKQAKNNLSWAIKASKVTLWKEICNDLEKDN